MAVTPEQLEAHIVSLRQRGYSGATFTDAVTGPRDGRKVAITFDDAFRSVYELAFPVMSRLGVPGTVFVPTELIGGDEPMSWPGIEEWVGGPHESELVGMSWEQVAELAAAGWEIGSHTRSHPWLTDLDDERLASELEGSRSELERRLGRDCTSLAYPYGIVDDRVEEAARAAGYLAAADLSWLPHVSGTPLRWPREGIYIYDDLRKFRRKVSPFLRRARSIPLFPLLYRVRSRLRSR